MTRKPVQSSNMRSIGYDESTKRLKVEFSSGLIYQYNDVPPKMYAALMNAEDKDKACEGLIHTGSSKYTKIA
jgi:hypothetical protein